MGKIENRIIATLNNRMIKLILVFVILSLAQVYSKSTGTSSITCSDVKKDTRWGIGDVALIFSNSKRDSVDVDFYLTTSKATSPPEKIDSSDWSPLEKNSFDPSQKTIFIIHGFKSGGRKSWVIEMKDKLHEYKEANIILVDWSDGARKKNYVNAARNTLLTANRIFNFLQMMRFEVELLGKTPDKIEWNHLHFIGHSLGAQISGQTAHLLKRDAFWKVERITGLDPAKHCFTNNDESLRLDKDDADFVDIIHTQGGEGGLTDNFGLGENIGHIDFYVNGGEMQPGCVHEGWTGHIKTMICSHKKSYKYFTQSLENEMTGKCKFVGYPWNGSREQAEKVLDDTAKGLHCLQCPEMGINAVKTGQRGKFLVLMTEEKPFCENIDYNTKNWRDLYDIIRRLKST